MKIFLIGFMGSGKTSIGKRLAKFLGFDFIDLDSVIETKEGKPISKIFMERGETAFRILEQEALQELVKETCVVVATGGGAPCHNNNLQFMNANGTTVYLRLDQEALLQRLTDAKLKRPLIKDLTDAELNRFIEEKMLERTPHYEQAHYTVESAHITNAAERIHELIRGSEPTGGKR